MWASTSVNAFPVVGVFVVCLQYGQAGLCDSEDLTVLPGKAVIGALLPLVTTGNRVGDPHSGELTLLFIFEGQGIERG